MGIHFENMRVVKLDGGSDADAARAADTAAALFGQAVTAAGGEVDTTSLADARARLRIVRSPYDEVWPEDGIDAP